jgi:hypothetical protein
MNFLATDCTTSNEHTQMKTYSYLGTRCFNKALMKYALELHHTRPNISLKIYQCCNTQFDKMLEMKSVVASHRNMKRTPLPHMSPEIMYLGNQKDQKHQKTLLTIIRFMRLGPH